MNKLERGVDKHTKEIQLTLKILNKTWRLEKRHKRPSRKSSRECFKELKTFIGA